MMTLFLMVVVFAVIYSFCEPRLRNDFGFATIEPMDTSYRLCCCGAESIVDRQGVMAGLEHMKLMATRREYTRYLLERTIEVSNGPDHDFMVGVLKMVRNQKAGLGDDYYDYQLNSGLETWCMAIINQAIAAGTIK